MRGRSFKLCSAVVLSLLVGCCVQFASSSEAAAFDEKAFQWNIEGTCSGGQCGNHNAVEALAWIVGGSSPMPNVITLNEVCAHDPRDNKITPYDYALWTLTSVGYTGYFVNTASPVNCGGGESPKLRQFGNAIFMRGQVWPVPTTDIHLAAHVTSPGNRRATCYNNNISGIIRRNCVAHLDPQDDYAEPQSAVMAFIITGTMNGTPTHVGADLNTTDHSDWPAWRSTSFHLTAPLPNPFERIDVNFGSKYGHSLSATTHPIGMCDRPDLSDHCMVIGFHRS